MIAICCKTIKTQDSHCADCLKDWRDCLTRQGKAISEKDFDKFWLSNYIRFDTCSKRESKQAGAKCSISNFDYVLQNKADIFEFENSILEDLKTFLQQISFNPATSMVRLKKTKRLLI